MVPTIGDSFTQRIFAGGDSAHNGSLRPKSFRMLVVEVHENDIPYDTTSITIATNQKSGRDREIDGIDHGTNGNRWCSIHSEDCIAGKRLKRYFWFRVRS
mmetsp:Transcript_19779/g.55196  ORF Transcript_19779/g.55196 Transcript_19779/m.55196 type:complete len:100 (-) Transcript_19779:480-779(-)